MLTLKITNDARKCGLDFRLIDPTAPDFPDSKVNVCAENVCKIWKDSTEDKGTQLVFCDLSTPKKTNKAQEQSQEVHEIIDDSQNLDNDDREQNELNEVINIDELIANDSNFSVYDDLKKKLIDNGIPEKEIAFIHDANTDQKKTKLFADVNNGDIRVLIGSTSKMGAGMNVQERLVSAHHLDAPWRPSDLEQRNGRIIRQGNKLYEKDPNFEVGIYNYATKQTYDARMWQCIESKATAIEQFRKGDFLQRSIEDVGLEASNAAEMKAAASGNPLILWEVNLKTEKTKIEALYNQHNRSKHRLEDRVKYLQESDTRFEKAKENHKENIETRDKNTQKITENGKEKIKLELFSKGQKLTSENAEELKKLVLKSTEAVYINKSTVAEIGKYRGFDIAMKSASKNQESGFRIAVKNPSGTEYLPDNLVYSRSDKMSIGGLFQRIDNFLEKDFDIRLERATYSNEREKEELLNAQEALAKGFDKEDELQLVRENHNAVLRELKYIQDDPSYKSVWKPKEITEFKQEKQEKLQKVQNQAKAQNQEKAQEKPQAKAKDFASKAFVLGSGASGGITR